MAYSASYHTLHLKSSQNRKDKFARTKSNNKFLTPDLAQNKVFTIVPLKIIIVKYNNNKLEQIIKTVL